MQLKKNDIYKMHLRARFKKYTLQFKHASGTSRGVLHTKETYFLKVFSDKKFGVGECSLA